MIVAKGNKVASLHPLFFHNKEDLLVVIEQPLTSIWHNRLGHMSRNGMEVLSRHGYLPKLSFFHFAMCEHFNMVSKPEVHIKPMLPHP